MALDGGSMMLIVSRKSAASCGSKTYFTGKPCTRGHVAERCVRSCGCLVCRAEDKVSYNERNREAVRQASRERARRRKKDQPQRVSESNKRYREKNALRVAECKKEWYSKNRERVSQERARQYLESPEKHRERAKAYYLANPEKAKSARAEYLRRYRQARRDKDTPEKVAKIRARYLLRRVLKCARKNKSATTQEMLGYSAAQLREHLERNFLPGMSWENHGEWHIDHVRPLSSFDLTDDAQIRAANSLENLRPLWAADNIKKSNKWVPECQLTLIW